MCGIAGIFGTERGTVVRTEEIDRMCRAIVHRGPDEQGMRVEGSVGLGMRRLSIIDLAGGQQPIYNEDRSVWVVYNGEIYNYPELRAELERAGHRFYTHCDTEVIPHLYEEHGAEFVKRLRGMFAIALYDEKRQKLVLARDRLGKKPLLYAQHGGRLLFGSEIRSLLAVAPELAQDIDRESLLYFFTYGYIQDPRSAFSKIHRLPPAHVLECEQGRVQVSQYWDIPEYSDQDPRSEEEWMQELETELAHAVRIRLMSDVPLGALLSGGVDSSTVVALMARASSRPVKTFSISFPTGDFNEGPYARKVAERFGTEHHELEMNPDFGETIERLTRLMEEPFGDSSMLPTYLVSRLVRQHVTVALAGDGGDEMFAGYDRYPIHLGRARFDRVPRWAGALYRKHLHPMLPNRAPGRRFLYNVSHQERDRYLDSISFLSAQDRDREFFSDDFLEWAQGVESPKLMFQRIYDQAPATNPLSKLQYLDSKTYLPGDILTKVDRMSMATSLEVRAPMLDHVFVELAARVPAQWKFRNGESKYILKRLAERVGVPHEVIYRRKQGFAVPLVHWLRRELKSDLVQILTEPRTLQRGYFRRSGVEHLLHEHLSGRRDRSAEIWILLIFELWHRNFLEQVGAGQQAFAAVSFAQGASDHAQPCEP